MFWKSVSAVAVRRTVQNRSSTVNHLSAVVFETTLDRGAPPCVREVSQVTQTCDTARPRHPRYLRVPLHAALSSAPSPLLPGSQRGEALRAVLHSRSDIYRRTRDAPRVPLDTPSRRRFW